MGRVAGESAAPVRGQGGVREREQRAARQQLEESPTAGPGDRLTGLRACVGHGHPPRLAGSGASIRHSTVRQWRACSRSPIRRARSLLFLLHQDAPENLSRGRLRDRVGEVDVPQPLVVRDVLLDEGHHRLAAHRFTGHHERLRHLATFAVRHGNDGRVRDVRVLQQHRLELGRRHLEALHLDQLLEPIDDLEVSVLVDDPDVAGVQPPVGVHRLCRRLGVVQIPLHHLRSAHPHFSALADADVLAGLRIDDPAFGARHQRTDLAGAIRAGHGVVRRGAGFGHAVALPHPHAEPRLHRVGELRPERRRAREQPLDLREIELVHHRMLGERHRNRRHDVRERDRPLLQHAQEHLEVELGERDARGAAQQAQVHHHHHAVDMEERQHAHQRPDLGRFDGVDLHQVGQEVAVRQHHPLGQARRA